MTRVIGWLLEIVSDIFESLWNSSNWKAEQKIAEIARVDAHAAVMERARLKRKRIIMHSLYYIIIILISSVASVILLYHGILNGVIPGILCLLFIFSFIIDSTGNISVLEAADVLKQKEPYALYLRAFKSDLSRRNFNEEDLVQKLLQQKVVTYAVGLPEEVDASPGAKRVYINDSTWQYEVLLLIDSAKYVFLRICDTDSCMWELEQVLSHAKNLYIIIDDANEYESVLKKNSSLPHDISLSPGMYVIYKRMQDGKWEQQSIEEPDSDFEYDDEFKENYIARLLETYNVSEKSSDRKFEKAIEGLISEMKVGWEQKYTTPIVARLLDMIEDYIYRYHGTDMDKALAYIKALQYLNMLKKFSPLEEPLLKKWNKLLDKVEQR